MATINYKKFDEHGNLKARLKGKTKRTVCESIDLLRRNEFEPDSIDKNMMSARCWTNGRGIKAVII